jgi:hypothetical protein
METGEATFDFVFKNRSFGFDAAEIVLLDR